MNATRPAVLRLADLWYPDWKVTVDGKPAPLLRADHALRAVAVPAGEHKIEFRFASRSFTIGFWLSVGCTLAALLLLAANWWLQRRPKEGVPEPVEAEGAAV